MRNLSATFSGTDTMTTDKNKWWRKLNGFDLFVIAGGAVNLLIIFYLIGYWLSH
jgi:hypothetical protein